MDKSVLRIHACIGRRALPKTVYLPRSSVLTPCSLLQTVLTRNHLPRVPIRIYSTDVVGRVRRIPGYPSRSATYGIADCGLDIISHKREPARAVTYTSAANKHVPLEYFIAIFARCITSSKILRRERSKALNYSREIIIVYFGAFSKRINLKSNGFVLRLSPTNTKRVYLLFNVRWTGDTDGRWVRFRRTTLL